MNITDLELRDKLATEFCGYENEPMTCFKAGWDAARANLAAYYGLECVQCGDKLYPIKTAQILEERDQLKAAAEKLAEALEFVSSNLGYPPSPPFPAPIVYSANKARETVAEYREKFSRNE